MLGIKNGEDFDDKGEYSADMTGSFTFRDGRMDGFSDAAFERSRAVSDLVESEYGYHIIIRDGAVRRAVWEVFSAALADKFNTPVQARWTYYQDSFKATKI